MNGHTPHSLEDFPVFISSQNVIIHYTCNAPSQEVLDRNKIVCLGAAYGCVDPREVLQIPLELYQRKGFQGLDKPVLDINTETLMVSLK